MKCECCYDSSEKWNISPGDVVMVGDSLYNDIQSGNAAGTLTVHFDRFAKGSRSNNVKADITVQSMQELQTLLFE